MAVTRLSDQATLAVLGAFLIFGGVFVWLGVAVGLVVGGVECVIGAYVAAYLAAAKHEAGR